MLPTHSPPLSQSDLARLDHFLHTAACGRDAMGLSYAHGFLTAVASGPEHLQADEWLRLVFDEPVFTDGAQAGEVLGLALRLFQEIEQGLSRDGHFRPVFEYVRGAGGEAHADAQRWCRGFTSGLALFSEYWTTESRAVLQVPLSLIFRLAQAPGYPDASYARLCDALPQAAETVYRYWLADTPFDQA
jgi:uncharacterized protein